MAQDRNAADLRVSAEALRRFIAAAYLTVGIPEGDAAKAAELMAQSDISGADGHGVFRLPQYIRRIKAGGLNTRPEITVIRRAKAAALVDGDNGLGSLVVSRAVEEAIALARDNGVGWVGVRRGNHAGAAAVYAAMPLAHDMIGLYFAVGNANHLPPWGGIDMLLSTNPIAVAVPALEEPPLILDMATTVAAYGKVKVAAQQGKTMPEGWMIDRQGQPLTDPNRADNGFLLPIGGYKGAALALMFGLLAGTLNGAANGADVVDFNKDDTTPTNTGQAICVLDIKAFAEPSQFKRQVDAVIRQLHGSALLPGFDEDGHGSSLLIPSSPAILSSAAFSEPGIGMPRSRRSAIRAARSSPGRRMRSKPGRRAEPWSWRITLSTWRLKAVGSARALMSRTQIAWRVLVGVVSSWLKSTTSSPLAAPLSVPARRPNISDIAAPLYPPIGSRNPSSERFGSVSGRPWRSIIHPSGIVLPCCAATLTLP